MQHSKQTKIQCFDALGNEYFFAEHEFTPRMSVYGLYRRDNALLLVQDSQTKQWELPGGGKEMGEEDEEALAREFFEETGLRVMGEVAFVSELQGYYVGYAPWKTTRRFYEVFEASGTALVNGNGKDTVGVRFISLDELETVSIKKDLLQIITDQITR